MAIMKLSNVPELEEFAGTEKIYVNDNGETKQIACDKVVTGGGERIVLSADGNGSYDHEYLVSLIEKGCDVWVKDVDWMSKVIGYNWYYSCAGKYLKLIYAKMSNGSVAELVGNTFAMIGYEYEDRLDNIPTV